MSWTPSQPAPSAVFPPPAASVLFPGVLVGVLVFELMKVALQFMNVNSSYTYIVQGLVIIVAVAIDIRKYLAKK